MRLLPLIVCALLAGCAAAPSADTEPAPGVGSEVRAGSSVLHNGGVRTGLSLLHLAEGETTTIAFPPGVLVLASDGHLAPADGPLTLARGELVQYLPPYGATSVSLTIDGEARELALGEPDPFVDGARVVDLLKVQRAGFPHRTPGHESYRKSIDYFAAFFDALGYEVERFETPLPHLEVPVVGASPESVVSVVAMKRGTSEPDRIIGFGGHFDVVEETTEGALDNTGGTMSVLALAESFSRINTSKTIMFAAWGGEEDGILGSQAWLTAHPELVPRFDLYLNYDVTGIAWPAPLVDPAPIVATTGPDGPIADAVAKQHQAVLADWMQLDVPFVYEPIAQGQAGGGVNAQSDHTPFMARGIPVLFQYTSKLDDAKNILHQEHDTLDNLAKYSMRGFEAIDTEFNATELAEGERALALSFESQMVVGFYLAVLTDAGVFQPANAAPGTTGVFNARS